MPDSKSLIHLSTDLATMFLESTDTDCELVTSSGDHLPVHSVLLKARSSYFRALLSSRWTVAGRETRLGVGKEALTMIVTFLYSGQVHLEGVGVELLFEVLENARMMGITDLEKELKDFIRLNLVAQALIQGKKGKAKLVFNVLNHGIAHQFPELVKTCLLVSKEFLQSSALELPYGYRGFLQLEEGVWSELGVLTSSSLALLMSTFSPQLAAWVVSFALQEDFWKGREVEVFKEVGPEIETEALEMLQDQTLLKILAFAGREELESRVTQVLVEREEILLALETEVEVKREAREAVARRIEQTMAESKATDERIYGLKMEEIKKLTMEYFLR